MGKCFFMVSFACWRLGEIALLELFERFCLEIQKYEEALEKYSEALEASPKDYDGRKVYFSNRAACHLQQERYKECVTDCSKALKIDNKVCFNLVFAMV